MLYEQDRATPFDFDIEITFLEYQVGDTFGKEILEMQDMKDLFEDFRSDKALFAQFWDTLNYTIEQEAGEYYGDF